MLTIKLVSASNTTIYESTAVIVADRESNPEKLNEYTRNAGMIEAETIDANVCAAIETDDVRFIYPFESVFITNSSGETVFSLSY